MLAGATNAVASGTVRNKPASVTLVVRDSAGQVVGQQAGTEQSMSKAALAAPGAYTWTVTGAGGVNWKMTLSYVSAGCSAFWASAIVKRPS